MNQLSFLPRRSHVPTEQPRSRVAAIMIVMIGALLSILVPASSAYAAGTVGNGTASSCTESALRTAISAGGTITFNCGTNPVTITVNSDLVVGKETVIDGGGTKQGGLVTISGGGKTRVFQVINKVKFTVKNLTIRDGKTSGLDSEITIGGAGIRGCWRCQVEVVNSVFLNNNATTGTAMREHAGGAIFVHATTLKITNSYFEGNKGINGGAVHSLLSGLTIEGSTFVNNDVTAGGQVLNKNGTAAGAGGAVYTDGGSEYTSDTIGGIITIRNSKFTSNKGTQGGGVFTYIYTPDQVVMENNTFDSNSVGIDVQGSSLGGGWRIGGAGTFSMKNTTFKGNKAAKQGGAFWSDGRAKGTFTNTTFNGNSAVEKADGTGGYGGALAGKGNWTCLNCTIAGNHAGGQGGGTFIPANAATLKNTIVANNTAANNNNGSKNRVNCYETLIDGGTNVQYPAKTTSTGDRDCVSSPIVGDPKLSALANNGSNTLTMALQSGSKAIDTGTNTGCPTTDQRNVTRPQGSRCDIGAFEYKAALTAQPAMAFINDGDVTLTVNGSDFDANSKILWNGSELATEFVDESTLRTQIETTQFQSTGPTTAEISVSNSELPPVEFVVTNLASRIRLPLIDS